jgi:hypothetical protein
MLQLTPVRALLQVIVNEKAKEQYVVYQCGCYNRTRTFPSSLLPPVPSGFKPNKVFEGPLQSISADDTSVGEFMVRHSAEETYRSKWGMLFVEFVCE